MKEKKKKHRRRSGGGKGSFYRLGRLAVARNLALALIVSVGAVLIVLIVMRYSSPTRSGSAEYDLLENYLAGTEPEAGGFYVPGDPNNFHPVTHPELYIETEFTYACGCTGTFIPAEHGVLGAVGQEQVLAELRAATCYRCRKLLEFGEQRAAIQKSEPGAKSAPKAKGG